jgi:hypothetical protein
MTGSFSVNRYLDHPMSMDYNIDKNRMVFVKTDKTCQFEFENLKN